jgi:hypothetical protein
MDHFGIMDSAGNMLDWFDDLSRAEDTFYGMVQGETEPPELALIAFDAAGHPVDTVRATHAEIHIEDSPWLRPGDREFHERLAPSALAAAGT